MTASGDVRVAAPDDEAVARTEAKLEAEGLGVLTEIDVSSTLKEKLDADFRDPPTPFRESEFATPTPWAFT